MIQKNKLLKRIEGLIIVLLLNIWRNSFKMRKSRNPNQISIQLLFTENMKIIRKNVSLSLHVFWSHAKCQQ